LFPSYYEVLELINLNLDMIDRTFQEKIYIEISGACMSY